MPYGKPQNMSNNEEVRWCALTGASGGGVVFIAKDSMSTSALAYPEQMLDTVAHPFQLPAPGNTYLHLDCGVTGLGGNSCGQGGPLEPDRIKAGRHKIGLPYAAPGLTLPRRQMYRLQAKLHSCCNATRKET